MKKRWKMANGSTLEFGKPAGGGEYRGTGSMPIVPGPGWPDCETEGRTHVSTADGNTCVWCGKERTHG